jgi:hypothetical protein
MAPRKEHCSLPREAKNLGSIAADYRLGHDSEFFRGEFDDVGDFGFHFILTL